MIKISFLNPISFLPDFTQQFEMTNKVKFNMQTFSFPSEYIKQTPHAVESWYLYYMVTQK